MHFQACVMLAVLCAALGCGAPDRHPAAERIVLITIDTLRADHVGVYGAGPGRTPTLDALAAEGVRFEVAISPAPLTLPSHATLLTGLDPQRHGVHHNGMFELRADVPIVSERLRARGYATAAFVSAFVLQARFGLARGFDHYDDRVAPHQQAEGAIVVAERSADKTVGSALDWLETAPRRFFLWVHLYDPHSEYRPPEPFARRFGRDRYAGEVAFADAQLGRLLEAIDARFGREGTAVVATSDHGEGLWQHAEVTHAYGIYETTQRVPLIVRAAGAPAGHVVRSQVRLADVAPTLLAVAGDDEPESRARSLLARVGREPPAPEPAYMETLATRYDMAWSPLYGVRTERWKYIRAPRPALYDLAEDPRELRDRAAELPDRVAELDAVLDGLLEGAPAAAPNRSVASAELEHLQALGYVLGGAAEREVAALRLGRVEGPDPRDWRHEAVRRNRANWLVGAGKPEEALELLGDSPDGGWMTFQLRATAAIAAGRPELAEVSARAVIANAPSLEVGYELLAVSLGMRDDLEGAEAAYREVLRRAPETSTAHLGLGRIFERRGNPEAARQSYRAALETGAPSSRAAWRLAALEIEAGRASEAKALLARLPIPAAEREPAALRLAQAEHAAGRSQAALARLEAMRSWLDESPELFELRGTILEDLGREREALPAREHAHRLAPDSPVHANNLAWTLAQLGDDLPRAEQVARRAVEASDRDPATLDTLATVLLRRGDVRAALALLDEALARPVTDELRATLLEHLAEARAALSDG